MYLLNPELALYLLPICITATAWRCVRKDETAPRTFLSLTLASYLCLLVGAKLLPLALVPDFEGTYSLSLAQILTPRLALILANEGLDTGTFATILLECGVHILAFVPFGLLVTCLHAREGIKATYKKALALTALFVTAQLALNAYAHMGLHTPRLEDIPIGVLGAAVGGLIATCLIRACRRMSRPLAGVNRNAEKA